MTISSTTSRWSYSGNGSTDTFAYNTKVFAKTDLDVYVAGTLKTVDTHYTVTGVGSGSGGNVVFTTGNVPAADASVVIVKDVPYTQGSSLPLGGAFPSTTVEAALDKLTILAQQLYSKASRVLRQPESDASDIGEIPAKSSRLGKYLRFNSTTGDPEVAALSDIGAAVLSDSNAQNIGTAAPGTSEELSRADHVHAIPNGQVSLAMLADLATQRLIGRNTGSTGVPEAVTLSQALDWIGSATRGDILYRGASAWARLPKGSSGQVLTMGANDPAWDDGGQEGWDLINTYTPTAVAQQNILGFDSSLYSDYKVIIDHLAPATDGVNLLARTSSDGGSSFDSSASNYMWVVAGYQSGTGAIGSGSSAATEMQFTISGLQGNAAGETISGRIEIINPGAAAHCVITSELLGVTTAGAPFALDGGGRRLASADVNGLQLAFNSGNIASGSIRFYGRRI